jgi:hypothetical protein
LKIWADIAGVQTGLEKGREADPGQHDGRRALGSQIYDWAYTRSPRLLGGCRGVKLSTKLQEHGFVVDVREYYQQLLFPSE